MTDDPNDLDRVDQEIRINELRHEAAELAGGEMTGWVSDDCPPDIAGAFWQRVVDYEKAPLTSDFEKLTEAGVELPTPDTMTDTEVTAKLWEIIRRLAERRVFVSQTNHLSDRELYAHLWGETLHEVSADMPFDQHSAYFIDLLGSGSDENTTLYLKYYADEAYRADWARRRPDDPMPPHQVPPYDRDRHLPQAGF